MAAKRKATKKKVAENASKRPIGESEKAKVIKNKLIYWIPRILVIAYILFLSMFALDIFGEYTFPKVLWELLKHLLPSLVLVGVLVIAWKRPRIGGWIFLLWGVIFTFFFDTYENPISLMIISLPLFIVGGLFFLDHKYNCSQS